MDRDTDALKAALEHHSVRGYKVVVPTLNEAVILEQGATGPVRHITEAAVRLGSPMVFYKVKAKTPVSFQDWVQKRFKSQDMSVSGPGVQLTLEDWKRYHPKILHMIPDYFMKRLEEGGHLSWADLEHDSLVQRGCIDQHDNVSCYTFWSSEVQIDPKQLAKGELVEYEYKLQDKDEKQFLQGRIVGFVDKGQTALLEVFTPISYLECPDSIDNDQIKKGFYSEGTFTIGYGAHEAFEIAEEETGRKLIPEGKWDQEHRTYTLKELFPIAAVKELCDMARDICAEKGLCDPEEWDREPFCLRHSLIMYIVPIKLYDSEYKGTWRPLPEHAVESEYVVSYDFEE